MYAFIFQSDLVMSDGVTGCMGAKGMGRPSRARHPYEYRNVTYLFHKAKNMSPGNITCIFLSEITQGFVIVTDLFCIILPLFTHII